LTGKEHRHTVRKFDLPVISSKMAVSSVHE
jgi:hypothetical protein